MTVRKLRRHNMNILGTMLKNKLNNLKRSYKKLLIKEHKEVDIL